MSHIRASYRRALAVECVSTGKQAAFGGVVEWLASLRREEGIWSSIPHRGGRASARSALPEPIGRRMARWGVSPWRVATRRRASCQVTRGSSSCYRRFGCPEGWRSSNWANPRWQTAENAFEKSEPGSCPAAPQSVVRRVYRQAFSPIIAVHGNAAMGGGGHDALREGPARGHRRGGPDVCGPPWRCRLTRAPGSRRCACSGSRGRAHKARSVSRFWRCRSASGGGRAPRSEQRSTWT